MTSNSSRLAVGVCLVKLLVASIASSEEEQADLELAKAALKEHYEYQRTITRERNDWKLGKEMLESRIDLLAAQIKQRQSDAKEQTEKISEVDEKKGKLAGENDELTKVQNLQIEKVEALERRVQKLVPVLPKPLRSKIQPLLDMLPEPGKERKDIKASVGERFQNAIGVLNEINKFHSAISIETERREVSGGRTAEVQTIYFGLSKAYYAGVGEMASEGGVGTPAADGWKWTPLPDEALEISRMIKMVSNEEVAGYVPLPVNID